MTSTSPIARVVVMRGSSLTSQVVVDHKTEHWTLQSDDTRIGDLVKGLDLIGRSVDNGKAVRKAEFQPKSGSGDTIHMVIAREPSIYVAVFYLGNTKPPESERNAITIAGDIMRVFSDEDNVSNPHEAISQILAEKGQC